ncbi:MAG: YgjV family protein [Clostridia bacterium]|nr:YgjV family protein [Clostridia bacterium]
MDSLFHTNETIRLIGTVFGWINVVFCLLIYISNKRSRILALKLSSDVFSALNMFLCNFRVAGALACIVAIFREIVFYLRTKKKWADHRIWLFIVIFLLLLSSVIDFILRGSFNPLALLPTFGSIFAAIGLFSKDTLRLKILVFIGTVPYLFYNIFSMEFGVIVANPNVPGIVAVTFQLISVVIGLIHEIIARRAVSDSENGQKIA